MLVQKISRKCEVDWLKHGNGSVERSFKQSYHMCNNLVFKTVISYFSVRNLGMHFVQIAVSFSLHNKASVFSFSQWYLHSDSTLHFRVKQFIIFHSALTNTMWSVYLITRCVQPI